MVQNPYFLCDLEVGDLVDEHPQILEEIKKIIPDGITTEEIDSISYEKD